MKHPRMRPTRRPLFLSLGCQNLTGPCGAQDVLLSILRGEKFIVKVPEKMDILSNFDCEHSAKCATPEQSTCRLLSEFILSIF